jgi:hypothetical protein
LHSVKISLGTSTFFGGSFRIARDQGGPQRGTADTKIRIDPPSSPAAATWIKVQKLDDCTVLFG